MPQSFRFAVPALAALALGGCLSFGPKVPPTLFSFTPDRAAPAGQTASGTAANAIVVLEPETDKRLAVTRIAVQVDASNVAYLQKAMWVERPSRLFQGLLAETIRAKSGRLVFTDAEASTSGALRLAGRLLDAGYDARTGTVVVRYDAIRQTAGNQVSTRRFEASEPVAKAEAAEVGPALNRAANKVAGEVADWIS
jgi:cholesterol transport system auxiliary component